MSRADNLATQERLGNAVNSGDLQQLHEIFALDVVDHDPAPGQKGGPEGYIEFFTTLRTAFPDAQLQVDQIVADDDHVALAYRLTGTHQGDFQGVAATGKRIEARGLQIGRFVDGKIVERWGSTDELGIMTQLGATITPGQ